MSITDDPLSLRKVQLHSQRFKTRYELHDRYGKLVTSIALGTSADAAWWKVRMGSFPPPADQIITGALSCLTAVRVRQNGGITYVRSPSLGGAEPVTMTPSG